jgi:hypothetical protein
METPHAALLVTLTNKILHHLSTKFVRDRLTGPRQMLLLLLAKIHSGVNRIGVEPLKLLLAVKMDRFLQWEGKQPPTSRALTQALRKLRPAQLESVIELGLAGVAEIFGASLYQNGYRLVAIDGVRINAQRTSVLARVFHLPKCGKNKKAHQPQALMVVARCVRTGVTLAQEIVKNSGSERVCARKMIQRLAAAGPLIVLLDRGFPSRELMGDLHEAGIKYITRMCVGKSSWRELRPLIWKKKPTDQSINLQFKPTKGKPHLSHARAIMTKRRTEKNLVIH